MANEEQLFITIFDLREFNRSESKNKNTEWYFNPKDIYELCIKAVYDDNNNQIPITLTFEDIAPFTNLNILNCDRCNLIGSLPQLPNTLEELYCNENKLTSLVPENGTLPPKLKILQCMYNNLAYLPRLPNSLVDCFCNHNELVSLFPKDEDIDFIKLPKSLSWISFDIEENENLSKLYPYFKYTYIYDRTYEMTNFSNSIAYINDVSKQLKLSGHI